MLRIKFLLGAILALTAWIHPAYAISAFAEQPQDNPTFINYKKFREQKSGNNEPSYTEAAKLQPVFQKNPIPSNKVISSGYAGKTYSKDEVIELIKFYSAQYGINPEKPLRIARCESGFNQFSKNKSSTASGVYQFLDSTWKTKPLAQQGKSVFDADANVQTAVWLMSLGKYSMWQCK